MPITCKRCGVQVRSYSPMRKWCVDCRRIINLEQAKARKIPRILLQQTIDESELTAHTVMDKLNVLELEKENIKSL